jgi:hypothetical protein
MHGTCRQSRERYSGKDGSVIQLDDTGNEKFYKAWPSKWDGPTYSAKGNDVAIETLMLTCERVEKA